MQRMLNRSEDTAVRCPRCAKGGGQPFRLAPDAAAVRVLLRCDHCHHRWSAIVDANDAMVTANMQLWAKK
jgi:transcriptional regulator NrdR family protein